MGRPISEPAPPPTKGDGIVLCYIYLKYTALKSFWLKGKKCVLGEFCISIESPKMAFVDIFLQSFQIYFLQRNCKYFFANFQYRGCQSWMMGWSCHYLILDRLFPKNSFRQEIVKIKINIMAFTSVFIDGKLSHMYNPFDEIKVNQKKN